MRSRPLNPARAELLANRAREMRAHPTLSEARLWQALRGRQLGVAFRRQAVVGECIVDFLAPAARLIVEVDGGYHSERARADARRERELKAAGYRVLRIATENVVHALPSVLRVIMAACVAEQS